MSCNALRLTPLAALLLLGGCETVGPNGSLDPGFGESARYNAAMHIIDPDPKVAAGAAMPGDSGAMGAAAVKRYRTNTVKATEQVNTTGGTSGSSGPRN